MKFKQKLIPLLPYLTVVFLITAPWFFHSGYLFFLDFFCGPNIAVVWSDVGFLLRVLMKILNFILPGAFVEKLVIAAVLFAVLMGGKKIASNFIPDKTWIFIVSLFALFNPFVYDRLMYGQLGIVISLAFLLLFVGYLIEFKFKKNKRALIYSGVWAGLAIHFTLQFLFFIALFYIILTLFSFKLEKTKPFIKETVLLLIVIAAVNSIWFFAIISNKFAAQQYLENNVSKQDLTAFQTAGDSSLDVLKNVTMLSGFWGKNQYRYIDLTKIDNIWGRSFIILLPIMFFGLWQCLRKKAEPEFRGLAKTCLVLFFCSAILAAGIRLPIFKEISQWLFLYFPFYKGFREPQKWVALIVVVYTIFISIGLNGLLQYKTFQTNKRIYQILLILVIFFQAPLLLWGFGRQINTSPYPPDWHEVNQRIAADTNCEGNTLFLPWHQYMSFHWVGRIIGNPAYTFFQCPVIQGTNIEFGGIYDNSGSTEGALLPQWLATAGKTDLLKNKTLNISHIILAKEVDWENYLWLEKDAYLTKVMETENLILFRVEK